MSSTDLIGPFFFGDEVGNTTTVTGANYIQMLQQFGVTQLRARNDLSRILFNEMRPLPALPDM